MPKNDPFYSSSAVNSTFEDILTNYLENNPLLKEFLPYCSILRWFNEKTIVSMIPKDMSSKALDCFNKLINTPFCSEFSNIGYTLNDILREYVLTQREVKARRKKLHALAAEAYHQLVGSHPLTEAWFDNTYWKVYAAEWLYHLSWVNPEQALQKLMHIFSEAFAVLVSAREEVAFCYEIFNRIDFEQVEWPDESNYKERIIYLREKLKMLLAYRDKEALDLLEELAATPDITNEQRASLYQWIGSTCFRETDQFARAKERLESAYKLNTNDWLINVELSAFYSNFGLLWSRMDLARQFANNVVRSDEKVDRGFIELGNICQFLSDWDEAIKWYKRAKKVDPQSLDALLGLSEVYAARRHPVSDEISPGTSDIENAIQLIDQAEKINPSIHDYALIRKGNIYRDSNRLADARKAFETAITEYPDRLDAYIGLGILYVKQYQYRQAEDQYNKAINANETEAIGYRELVGLFKIQGKYERAIEECKKALDIKGIKSFQLYWELSDLYKSLERWDEMEASWKLWMDYDPGCAYIAYCLMGDAYKEQAWKQRSPKEVGEFTCRAQAQYEKALEIDANLAGTHVGLAELAILQKDSEKYSEHMRLVEDLSPWAVYDMIVRLGQAKTRIRSPEEAIELLDKAVGIVPQRNEARLALGDLFRGESNEERFLQTWDEIVGIDPTLRYSRYLNSGDFYQDQIDYDQARSQYEEAIKLDPDLAEAYLRLAYLSKVEGKQDEAKKHFTKAKDKASAYEAEALAEISTIHLDNKNFKEAESTARKAIFSDPELIHGYHALAQLGIRVDNQKYIDEARKLLINQRPRLIPDLDCEIAKLYIESNEILDANVITKAEKAFRRSIRESKKQNTEKAEACLGLATILVQEEKIYQAEKFFNRALDLMNPEEDFLALLRFGEAHEKANLLYKAEDHYRQAIAILSDHPLGHLSLACVYRKQDLIEKARREYAIAREAAGVGYLELGNYYLLNEGKWEDALECYHLGIESLSDKGQYDLYLAAGSLHADKNDWSEAQNDFQKAILLDPGRPEPYQALMQLFIMRKQYQRANRIHQQMAKQTSLAYDAHLSFGNILQENNRLKQAERAFRLAIQTDQQRIDGYITLIKLLQMNNRFDEAILLCQEMAEQPGLTYYANISIGNLLFDQKEIPKAEEYYQKAIALKSDQLDAYLQLAEIYSQGEKFREAKQTLLKALAVAADEPLINLGLAKVCEQQRKFDEAVQYYHKVAELETDAEAISAAYTSIGTILIDQGKQQEAVHVLEKALEKDPTNAEACYFLGLTHELLQNYNKAEYMYDRATDIHPKCGEAYIALGRVYRKLRKSWKVAQIEKKIMHLVLEEGEQYSARMIIARSFAEAGARKRAEVAYRDLIMVDPTNQDAYTMLAGWLVDWKEFESAVEIYKQMGAQPDLFYQAHILLGDLQTNRGLYSEAEQAYRQSIAKGSDKPEAYLQLGQMYLIMSTTLSEAEKYVESEKAFLEAIQQAPQEPDGYVMLANLYRTMGRNEDAERQIHKALLFDPKHLEANQLMAVFLEQKGRLKDAIHYYRQCAEVDQNNEEVSSFFEHIGDLYIRLGTGRDKQAVKALNRAIHANPSNVGAYYSLGMIYERQGEEGLKRAKEKYERTISINPYYGDAYVALGRVCGILKDIQGVHRLAQKVDELELHSDKRYSGYLIVAAAYREGNFLDWAIEELNKAINLIPKRMEAYEELGNVLTMRRRWNSALQAYKAALEVAKSKAKGRLHTKIGYCYFNETKNRPVGDTYRQANEKEASQEFRKTIKLNPNQYEGYQGLADLYENQERWEEAISVYNKMAASVSEMASNAYLCIASIHRRLGQLEEMTQACQNALLCPIDPDSPEYFNEIRRNGLAHFMIAELQKAEERLSKVIDCNAQDFQARLYHALNLLSLGNKEYARIELETGISMTRTEDDYRYVIEEASVLAMRQPEITGAKEMLSELIAARDRKRLVLS